MERRPSSISESSMEPMDISNKTTNSEDNNNTSSTMAISKLNESINSGDSENGVESEENDENIVRRENLHNHNNHQNFHHNIIDTKMLRKKFRLMNNHKNSNNNNNNNFQPFVTVTTTPTTITSDQNDNIKTTTNNNIDTNLIELKCPICDLNFESQNNLTEHLKEHKLLDNMQNYKCRICSKNLSSASALDRHMLIHSGERPYICKYCNVTFTTNGNMHRHMRTHKQHLNENKNYESSNDEHDDVGNDERDMGGVTSDASSQGSRDSVNDRSYNKLNNNYVKFMTNQFESGIGKRKNSNDDDDDNPNSLKRQMRQSNYNHNNNIIAKHLSQHLTFQPTLNLPQKYCCPVCDRNDFQSMLTLDNHLDKEHPSIQAKCRHCDVIFKSHKALNAHRCTKSNQNITQGFKDLTFVDFSSEKFPIIAKSVCEQSIRTPITSQKYECPKCYRAFPCTSSVEIHVRECGAINDSTFAQDFSLRKKRQTSETSEDDENNKRDDFFANLDLQNKSGNTMTTTMSNNSSPRSTNSSDNMRTPSLHQHDSKDLADIQSIINVTSSGGFLRQLDKPVRENLNSNMSSSKEDDEAQDAFTAEFRKMKLRGEFPCKLCTAIFPNLRALKGHNRIHLSAAGAGPYHCNMCPYSIHDKAALIRHMRTHNGDRPYECAVCNYAFTTKANCERHLKNRHAKASRDEVKRSIIYHPSEDATADEHHHHSKKMSMFSSPDFMDDEDHIPKECSTPVSSRLQDLLCPDKPHPQLLPKTLSLSPSPLKIQVKSLEQLIHAEKSVEDEMEEEEENEQNEEDEIEEEEEDVDENNDETKPIDLSMDALDLSKKSNKYDENKSLNLSINNNDEISMFEKNQQIFMAQQQQLLSEAFPKIDPAHYFQLSHLYRNLVFPPTGFPIHPFLLQNPLIQQNMNEAKDMMRGQMSGGNLMFNNPPPITPPLTKQEQVPNSSPNHNNNNSYNSNNNNNNNQNTSNNNNNNNINNNNSSLASNLANSNQIHSPIPHNNPNHSPNISHNNSINQNHQLSNGPVKMVIKNGVLMPKQKQRRYRTERPFACEHCSARFTLRSNMERHIKQQHPQFWAQRQRSGHSILRRGSGPPPPPQSSQNIPPVQIQQLANPNNFSSISEQVKYAILAQQLKYNKDHKIGMMPTIAQNNNNNNNNNINNNNNPQNINNNQIYHPHIDHVEEEDDPQLVIDEDSQPEDLTKLEKKSQEPSNVIEAKKIAETILEQARKASNVIPPPSIISPQQIHQPSPDVLKDFDLKISPNLIPKSETLPKYFARDSGVKEEGDLVSVSKLVDNANLMSFGNYFRNAEVPTPIEHSDEEGLVASGSASESNTSGPEDQNIPPTEPQKKKSAYSLAPNRVACPYCQRMFPWSSSLRRHILTHTGQKPFKCSHCPLLFTTKSNCDRHLLRKHGNVESAMSVAVPIDENIPEPIKKETTKEITEENVAKSPKLISNVAQNVSLALALKTESTGNSSPISSELPFKCHLCDGSFSERLQCLEHIKNFHTQEFTLLMAKGAIEGEPLNSESPPSNLPQMHSGNDIIDGDDGKDGKGKYPDYANRKVICAFCIRRFWSTEDLRRHMRTHSGERPFQCDICLRKFTLKHSMLRHQKKHGSRNSSQQQNISGSDMSDEEQPTSLVTSNKLIHIPDLIPKELAQWKLNQIHSKLMGLNNNNGGEGSGTNSGNGNNNNSNNNHIHNLYPFLQLQQRFERKLASLAQDGFLNRDPEDDSDLIGNLLGISDQGILNKVLLSSADEAAKLLGVDK